VSPWEPVQASAKRNHLTAKVPQGYLRDFVCEAAAMDELENTIRTAREKLDNTLQGQPDRAEYLFDLAIHLVSRFEGTGEMVDLEEAIQNMYEAVKTEPDNLSRAEYSNRLGKHLRQKWKKTSLADDLDKAIQAAQGAVNAASASNPERASYLSDLAFVLGERYSSLGSITDIQDALGRARQAVDATPVDDPDRLIRLNNIGALYSDQYARERSLIHLENALSAIREVVSKAPTDHPARRMFLQHLEKLLEYKDTKAATLNDLNEIIEVTRQIVSMTSSESPERVFYLIRLDSHLQKRCSMTVTVGDASEMVKVVREVLTRTTYIDTPHWLSNLGCRLMWRYARTDATSDHDEAIELTQKAIDLSLPDHPNRATFYNNLGDQLARRYARTNVTTDLEQAIKATCKGLESLKSTSPLRAMLLNNLGDHFSLQYQKTSEMEDLHKAIEKTQEAIDISPPNFSHRSLFLQNLANLLGERFSRTMMVEDINDAVEVSRDALKSAQSKQECCGCLDRLSISLGYRYEKTQSIDDIKEAISHARMALSMTAEDNPRRLQYLCTLGRQLRHKSCSTGEPANLEDAIEIMYEAVKGKTVNRSNRVEALNSLGTVFVERYLRSGAITDLDEAVHLVKEALDFTEQNDNTQRQLLNNVGVQLGYRFLWTGALSDIEEAVRLCTEGARLTPEDHSHRATILNNLQTQTIRKYIRTRRSSDLDAAIKIGYDALKPATNDQSTEAGRLSNLSTVLVSRYYKERQMPDLDVAIDFAQKAVDVTATTHPNRALYLNNLSLNLESRYSITRKREDHERALKAVKEAVDTISKDNPFRGLCLKTLGGHLYDEYLRSQSMDNLANAAVYEAEALQLPTLPTSSRIRSGFQLMKCCAIRGAWNQAYQAVKTAIPLIPRLTSRSLRNADRQFVLSKIFSFACDAAAVALQTEQSPATVLEILEIGRGVLATSLDELRVDILDLKAAHTELADRFTQLRDELDSTDASQIGMVDVKVMPRRADADRRYEAGKEFDNLIEEIRGQPGFENFLRAPHESEVRKAAASGPIVLINVSERCDAILIEESQIRTLALPNVKRDDVRVKLRSHDLGSPVILEWLWDTIAKPVLDELGYSASPSGDSWPHVWWIPTGALSRFPLHAAGYHINKTSESVLDRVMSSYSSSVKTILNSRSRQLQPITSGKAVLVAIEHTPGFGNLPLRFANPEISEVNDLCKEMAVSPVIPSPYKQDVLSILQQCKIFHFAGHGHTDNVDPSLSHLLLTEGNKDPLTVANILDTNIRKHGPFLAYLSACETGTIENEKFADESIHLISAFQLAGFRHVIGTLWEVNDETCVDIARITYEGLKEGLKAGHMADEALCRGLHNAIRELRARWLAKEEERKCNANATRKAGSAQNEANRPNDNTHNEAYGDSWLPRKLEFVEDNESGPTNRLHWVPYVHFGV
jgi:tetratricopeptide (TPR) repeat protein